VLETNTAAWQRGLDRVGEAALDPTATHQPVDHHLDRVLLVAREAHP